MKKAKKREHWRAVHRSPFERWAEIQKRFCLSSADIQMARTTGFGPSRILAEMDALKAKGKTDRERLTWLRKNIRDRYRVQHGTPMAEAPSIEEMRTATKRRNKQKKRRKKREKAAAASTSDP